MVCTRAGPFSCPTVVDPPPDTGPCPLHPTHHPNSALQSPSSESLPPFTIHHWTLVIPLALPRPTFCIRSLHRVFRRLSTPVALLALGLACTVLGAKFALIHTYGSDLPFWDQWDAEADQLYTPYARGELGPADLLRPHNEHRIVPTKLLALALLLANGQWDARLQMTVNAALHVTALVAWFLLLTRRAPPLATLVLFPVAAAIFTLPLAWENTLAGFQSQFYFMILFAGLHLGGTFLAPPGSARWWLAQVAGLAGVFSLAAGMASAAVVVGLGTVRALRRRRFERLTLTLLGVNLGLIALALALRTDVSGHAELRTSSFAGLLRTAIDFAAWPAPWLHALPVVLAPHFLLWWRAWSRPADPTAWVAAAFSGWWFLEIALLAYGRGGAGLALSPRYLDISALGLCLSLWGWLRLIADAPSPARRGALAALTLLYAAVAGAGLVHACRAVARDVLAVLPEVNAAREDHVRRYVTGRDPAFFTAAPWNALPYPDAPRLALLLDRRELRPWLPPSVRPPLTLENLPPAAPPAAAVVGRPAFTIDLSYAAAVNRPILRDTLPYLSFWQRSDSPAVAPLVLATTGQVSRRELPAPTPTWRESLVATPPGPFRLVATIAPGEQLEFTAPVEVGRLGVWSRHALSLGPGLIALGAFALLVALARGVVTQLRARS